MAVTMAVTGTGPKLRGRAQGQVQNRVQIADIPASSPVLIFGPTAAGKSALAAQIVERGGGVVVNADASQVFAGWRILTARPPKAEESRLPHALYGHVPFTGSYSAGAWLRDIADILRRPLRPVIVGGTGLYFRALTEGLADIPPVPATIRARGDTLPLPDLIAGLDAETAARIDLANRARVQRAWEVLQATGRGLARWQDDTPPPLLPLVATVPLLVMPQVEALNARIAARVESMLDGGLLDEARGLHPLWHPDLPAARAIGAREVMAHLDGALTLDRLREEMVTQTRQYAKRQRTWARARMRGWSQVVP